MANLRLDLRSKYSLLHAFDEVGRARFPNDWRGDEAWTKPAPTDLVGTQLQREEAKVGLASTLKQIIQVKAEFSASQNEAERNILSSLLSDLYGERDNLNKTIVALPDPTLGDIEDGKKFARRSEVEQQLNVAFCSGDLMVHFDRNSVVPWNDCAREDGLTINYILSQVTLPTDRASTGAHPAFIDRAQLDDWLGRMFKLQEDGNSILTSVELLRLWLENQVRTLKPREKTKAVLKTEAIEEFPDLTNRLFEQVWANTVPKSWKKAGRKPD